MGAAWRQLQGGPLSPQDRRFAHPMHKRMRWRKVKYTASSRLEREERREGSYVALFIILIPYLVHTSSPIPCHCGSIPEFGPVAVPVNGNYAVAKSGSSRRSGPGPRVHSHGSRQPHAQHSCSTGSRRCHLNCWSKIAAAVVPLSVAPCSRRGATSGRPAGRPRDVGAEGISPPGNSSQPYAGDSASLFPNPVAHRHPGRRALPQRPCSPDRS